MNFSDMTIGDLVKLKEELDNELKKRFEFNNSLIKFELIIYYDSFNKYSFNENSGYFKNVLDSFSNEILIEKNGKLPYLYLNCYQGSDKGTLNFLITKKDIEKYNKNKLVNMMSNRIIDGCYKKLYQERIDFMDEAIISFFTRYSPDFLDSYVVDKKFNSDEKKVLIKK